MTSFFAPFSGWIPAVPDPEQVVTMSFEQYAKKEVQHICDTQSHSYLHVVMPPEVRAGHSLSFQDRNQASGRQLRSFMQKGIFKKTPPAFYLYQQIKGDKNYIGLVAAVHVQTLQNGLVLPHEETIAAREEKLTDYLDVVGINAEPVCLTYQDQVGMASVLGPILQKKPDVDFSLGALGNHRLWVITDSPLVQQISEKLHQVDQWFIADGHHRTASSLRLAQQRKGHSLGADQYFMATIFAGDMVEILPFHRMVKGLDSNVLDHFLAQLKRVFEVVSAPYGPEGLSLWFQDQWFQLRPLQPLMPHEIWSEVVSNRILAPMFGIEDLRRDDRVGFLGGVTQPEALVEALKKGGYQLGFYLPALSREDFFAYATTGKFMPPKSTWFEPKLPNGLTMLDLQTSLG
jgi:uncharacterized protein (DUF1015 family)